MVESKQENPINVDRNPTNPRQAGVKRYVMKQKMVSIGNDYWVENDQGQPVFEIDGRIGLRKTFHLKDANGNKLLTIRKVMLTLKETMEIESSTGEQRAVVKKDLFTPLKEHFVVEVKNGPKLDIHGNILDHEYTIDEGRNKVAQVSKQLLHIRDSYTISVEPGQEDAFILAVVVCIDEMTHAGN